MKKIRLKTNCIKETPTTNYITDYLGTLGINPQDAPSFIDKPRPQDEEPYIHLDNIREVARIIFEGGEMDKNFFVQVDADADGYTSAGELISYLKRRWPNIKLTYRLHDGKQHGVIVNTVPQDTDIVIIPDAGSNQCAEHRELTAMGKQVIILDHHEINEELFVDGGAIIVNNQRSKDCINKNLSGAGVVYKTLQCLDDLYFPNDRIAEEYADLASIGIIADAMNMLQLDNNFIAYKGLNNIQSKLIRQIALSQSRGIKDPEHLTKIDVAFYIAPIINGVIRSGDEEDKTLFFRALIENDCKETFHTTWRGKDRYESLYEIATRLATNAKGRQDSGKKKSFEWLCNKVQDEHLNEDNIIIIPLDEKESTKINPNITGLVAMELVKKFNKPCLLLRETKEEDGSITYGGSGRNGSFYGLPNLLDFLHESHCVDYAEGHQGAFGAFLKPEQVQQLRDYANQNLNAQSFEKVYEVDYWFHTGETVNYDMLMEFAKYDYLYGNSIPQPKFCIDTNFVPEQITFMGATGTSIKIALDGGVDCIAFNDEELKNQLNSMPFGGHVTIIGRPQVNEWMGRKSVQLMIDDIEVGEKVDLEEENKQSTRNLLDLI